MANDILSAIGSSTDLTITLASLANGSARQATQITDATPSIPKIRIFFKVTTGTSPTAGGVIEFFLSRADDNASELAAGGTGTSDAAFSGDVNTLEHLYSQPVTATSDTAYIGSFDIVEPGTDWRLVVKNSTGAALNATGGNHVVRYETINPQVQ